MSHKGIRNLLEQTALGLRDDIQVTFGLDTDFNQAPKKSDLMLHVDPLEANPGYRVNDSFNYMKQWRVTMMIVKPDKAGVTDLYPIILDETDGYVDRFVNNLNFFTEKSDQITISQMSQLPIIKATADRLTGWQLILQILATDDFEYCRDC